MLKINTYYLIVNATFLSHFRVLALQRISAEAKLGYRIRVHLVGLCFSNVLSGYKNIVDKEEKIAYGIKNWLEAKF